ncbi:hypothetical protein BKA64DRAFT_412779 [Cadophora sp. MPI-SDFR-AT-0126]|nr:hypothetical protein BKA64DRAFT_412779 [Leotiomycetes sp. MPI-SDFR-AT-0126]
MSQIRRFFTEGIGTLLHQRAWRLSERALQEYNENLTRPALSTDLVDALGRLNDDQRNNHPRQIFQQHAIANDDGVLQWDEQCFKKWIMTSERPVALCSFVPTLWRAFVYFAGYPWIEDTPTGAEQPVSHHRHIDEYGFVLAYNLLPLRGVELLGYIENSWAAKYPRLKSLMFNSLGTLNTGEKEYSERLNCASRIEILENQLVDAIIFTRPEPYISLVSHREDVKQVAKRLALTAPCHESGSSLALSRTDIQTLLQLILLLRIDSAPWRPGLIRYMDVKRRGDIERPFFVHGGGKEVFYSASLAQALIQHGLGEAQFVPWTFFHSFCSTYPNILLRFYELWTSICLDNPLESPATEHDHLLPNSIVQSLSLIGPATFDCPPPGGPPSNEDVRQLQLDMQNAMQVFSSTSTLALDLGTLVERLNNAELFHILVADTTGEQNEEASAGSGSTNTSEGLFTFFTSTAGKEIMCEGTPQCPTYTWRYGFVQLLPQISTSPTGGLTAGFLDDTTLELFPHNQSNLESRQDSTSFMFDLKNGTLVVQETGNSLLRLKLTSLKCFQMPGTAATFSKSY